MRPVFVLLTILVASSFTRHATAQTASNTPRASSQEQIQRATATANRKQSYRLAYKLRQGDKLQWSVEHIASTRTQMAGESEETSSRSESIKVWDVRSVDSRGKMTFDHRIDSVNMWQKIGEDDPVKYNSKTDSEPPLEYEALAEKVGTVIATISVTPNGQIVDRKSPDNRANFGVGSITVPLPDKSVPVGYKWSVPDTLRAKAADGSQRQLKSRVVYELVKVKSGNAYISFKTEVLTPIESEKIRSQIMQQMTRGYLVFDIKRGYTIRKEVEWDEKVQGFEGPDSLLEYLARLTERVIDPPQSKVTRKPASNQLKPLQ